MQKKSCSPAQHIPKPQYPQSTVKKDQMALMQLLWYVLLCNWNLVKLFVASAGGPNIAEKSC
jgi:hypothetical protein